MDFEQFSAHYDQIYLDPKGVVDGKGDHTEEHKMSSSGEADTMANPLDSSLHHYIPKDKKSYGFKAFIVDSKGAVKQEEFKIYKEKETIDMSMD